MEKLEAYRRSNAESRRAKQKLAVQEDQLATVSATPTGELAKLIVN